MADGPIFQIVNFDANLLSAYYGAKQSVNSLLTLPPVKSNVSLSNNNNISTPWDRDLAIARERFSEDTSASGLFKLLVKDYKAIQNQTEFIDRRDASVRNSKLDLDSKNLFILYNALKDLKTLAEYAGNLKTSENELKELEAQFQLGLSQVKDFVSTEKFDRLTLLFAEKANNIRTLTGLGRREYDYIGPVIHLGEITDPISSLSGGETFTFSITQKTTINGEPSENTENFNVTIPTLEADRTLETLIIRINAAIQAVKTTNADDEEVPLFNTRFFAEETETNKFAIRIKTDFSEDLNFSASDIEPAIYMTGNATAIDSLTKSVNDDIAITSFITKITNLDQAAPTQEFHIPIYSKDSEELLVPEETASNISVDPLLNAAETKSNAIATDSKGNIYTVGSTDGRFANHLNTSEDGDAFLNKYDATGKLLWSRLVGSQGEGQSFTIAVDSDDNIIIAGQADKLSSGESNDPLAINNNVFDGQDSFVVKYNNVGTQQWMHLNDEYGTDAVLSITTDSNGDVYVTGKKNSLELSDTVLSGNDDAYVLKLDGASGVEADYIEIGSTNYDFGQAIAVAADGNIIIGTHENGHLILQKLDKDDFTNELWSYDYGDIGVSSNISNITVEGNRIYVSGSASNSLTGGGTEITAPLGAMDGFILAIDDAGNSATADWTKFIGTSNTDRNGGAIVSGGKLYISGTTSGIIAGSTLHGSTDSYAMKIDATTGATEWIKQLGKATENRETNGIAFASQGTSVLTKLGLPIGEFADDEDRTISTQTTARPGDFFYIKVNNSTTKKIEIKEGDTYRTLANRINRVSFRYINATVTFSTGTTNSVENEEKKFDAKAIMAEKLKAIQDKRNGIVAQETFTIATRDVFGNSLKIASKDGARIEIIAGRGEKDALKKLGLEASLILSTKELFDLEKEEDSKFVPGGVFSFKMDDRFSVFDKRDARFVTQELEFALTVVQSAYRSLTYDPVAEQIKKDALRKGQGGRVPPHLLKQLSNYQDGLNRISALVPQGGSFF